MRLLTLIALVIFISGCNNKKDKKEAIRPVFFQKLSESNISGTRTFAGVSQAENEAKLSFKVGGTLEEIHYKLGEPVKKGSILAHLNSNDYKINYQKALAAKKNAEIQLSAAKSNYERIEKLYATNNASLSDFEKVKTQYESAKTMLQSAETQLKAAKNQLDYTKLKAPYDGSISKIMAKENEMIGAGRPVLMFSSNGNIEIRAQVPENIIHSVKVGMPATITIKSIGDKKYKGVVSEIGKSTGGAPTYPLIIDLPEKHTEILPGMACTIEMSFTDNSNNDKRIIVPPDAVAHDENGDFVFTLKKSDQEGVFIATRKNVTLGKLTSNGYEILSGLSPDDIIITAGLSFMYDGRKVRLLEN